MSSSRRPRRSNAPHGIPFTPTPPPAEATQDLARRPPDAFDKAPHESAPEEVTDVLPEPFEQSADEPEPLEHSADELPLEHEGAARPPARLRKYLILSIAVVAALGLVTVITGAFARARRSVQPLATQPFIPEAATDPTDGARLPLLPALPMLDPSPDAAEDDAGFATDAAGAKREALVALDAWRLTEAIAAGERAVGFDPNDGEAWLILGAAYQVSGQMVQAKRCYATCVRQGRHDPRGECAAMLQ